MNVIYPAIRSAVYPAVRGALDISEKKQTSEQIIQSLFAQGQQGFWLPFTDFASLSQDSAGTLPYTALEQPVGLILDKSKGGGRGPELSPNGGTFDDAAGWTITQPTSSISGGVLNVGAGACDIFPPTTSVVVGKSYEVTFTISNSTANYGIRILNRDIIGTGNYFPAGGQYITANGSYRFVCVAISNGSIGINRVNGHTGSLQVDNFSVKEIPGNHATQPTSTARGVVSARVNMLQSTESLLGGWGRFAMQGSATLAVPTATNTQHYVQQSIAMITNTGYVISMEASAQGYRYLRVGPSNSGNNFDVCFDLQTGTIALEAAGGSSTITPLTGGRFLLRIPFIATLTQNATVAISVNNVASLTTLSFSGDGVSGIEITKATCVPVAQSALPYQRVNTPTDYDAVGFPKYLLLDGTDDSYTCGGGGSTTGFYYSDVVRPTTSTFSALLDDTTAGGGYLVQRTNTGIHFSAKAGGVATAVYLPLEANVQAFVLAMDDGVNLTLQVNSAQVSVARPAVTAGSATMYLERYTTIAQYFSGSITEPIYRAGPPPNAYERDVIRNYQKQKAGML